MPALEAGLRLSANENGLEEKCQKARARTNVGKNLRAALVGDLTSIGGQRNRLGITTSQRDVVARPIGPGGSAHGRRGRKSVVYAVGSDPGITLARGGDRYGMPRRAPDPPP